MKTFQKKTTKELLWFTISVIGSFLFWCALALIMDQKIILDECLYDREGQAFMMTIVFVYFIRLSAWVNWTRVTGVIHWHGTDWANHAAILRGFRSQRCPFSRADPISSLKRAISAWSYPRIFDPFRWYQLSRTSVNEALAWAIDKFYDFSYKSLKKSSGWQV